MAKTLLEVLPEQGIVIEPSSNGRWVAVCPFHKDDRDPSFTIYTHNDTYFCFGCNVWGDPVKFLVEYKGWTAREAMEYVGVNYETKKADKAKVIKTKDVSRTWGYLYNVSLLYHAHLLKTDGAWNYLTSRGLTPETIYSNQIGYTDGRVLNIEFASDYQIALECGLINSKAYEMLSHRITIPNFNGGSNVDFIMGRTVINDNVKYLGTRMPKPLYGFSEFARSPILFLSEGQFDWLILKQWGYPSIILSGSHMPAYHRNVLRDKFIVIVPDNDIVGMETARKVHASLTNSVILDYSSLGVKDIGELGMLENGQILFQNIVEGEEWYKTIHLSKDRWMKWLPSLLEADSFQLT